MADEGRRGGRGARLRGPDLKPPAGVTAATLHVGRTGREDLAGQEDQPGQKDQPGKEDREYLVLSYPLPAPAIPEGLTLAEREIAILLVRGLSSRAVAVHRGVSVHTVANQIRSLYSKLGVSSRVELLRALRR